MRPSKRNPATRAAGRASETFCMEAEQKPEDVIARLATTTKHGDPFSLILVDTLAAWFDGNDINDNVQAGEFVRRIRHWWRCRLLLGVLRCMRSICRYSDKAQRPSHPRTLDLGDDAGWLYRQPVGVRKRAGTTAGRQFTLHRAKDMVMQRRPWHSTGQVGHGGVCAERADRERGARPAEHGNWNDRFRSGLREGKPSRSPGRMANACSAEGGALMATAAAAPC